MVATLVTLQLVVVHQLLGGISCIKHFEGNNRVSMTTKATDFKPSDEMPVIVKAMARVAHFERLLALALGQLALRSGQLRPSKTWRHDL